jgi:hypothetical protein
MGVYERYVENAFSSVANDNYEKGSTFDSEGVKYVDTDFKERIRQLVQ